MSREMIPGGGSLAFQSTGVSVMAQKVAERRLLLHFYSVGRRRRRLQVGHLPGVLFQPSVTAVFARGFGERERERERETNNH